MFLKLLPFLLFTFIFLVLANLTAIRSTLTGFGKPKPAFERAEDTALTQYIAEKTGLEVQEFYIVNSDKPFGGMSGVPGHPIMTLSQGMLDTFTEGEVHYVLLHEAGHFLLWHPLKSAIIQLLVIVVVGLTLRTFNLPTAMLIGMAVGFAVVAGIGVTQFGRQLEWQADTFTLERLEDPQHMITATQKFAKAWDGPADDSLIRKLFYVGISYSQRIEYAEQYNNFQIM